MLNDYLLFEVGEKTIEISSTMSNDEIRKSIQGLLQLTLKEGPEEILFAALDGIAAWLVEKDENVNLLLERTMSIQENLRNRKIVEFASKNGIS